MMFAKLALRSLLDRKGSVALSLLAMTVSITVLLGVEHIRHQTKQAFSNTVSGVDLIVGARTSRLNLLLYSVFRIGSATNNIRWETFEAISNNSKVKWAVPISLGDSHKGYRVLGTSTDYFQHFSYGKRHRLTFAEGQAFDQLFDVVLGYEVAKQLGYQIGDQLILAHGIAATSFSMHKEHPFTVVGILNPTGTPVDQSLHVSLQGIEAIHVGWQQGVKVKGGLKKRQVESALSNLQPKSITAVMLGLESKMTTFRVQRSINNYSKEPLLAILPGVALSELWQMMSVLEKTLQLVSVLVFIAACLGVSAMLLSSIRERSREIQLLRVIGAPTYFLFFLIELEALLITVLSIVLGIGVLAISLFFFQDQLVSSFGIYVEPNLITENSLVMIAAMVVASTVVAIIPSISGYIRATLIQSKQKFF